MSWLPDRYRELIALLRRGRVEADIDEEFEYHLAMRTEMNQARGLSAEAARQEAVQRFGAVERHRDQTRRIDAGPAARRRWSERLGDGVRAFRLAVRSALHRPGFSAVVVITLAVGMAASTAIYTLLDRVVLRPLAYPAANRLVAVEHPVPGLEPNARWNLSVAGYFHFKRHSTTLEQLGSYRLKEAAVGGRDGVEEAMTCLATAGMLDIVGARPAFGRLFTEEEDRPGQPLVLLLSHAYWVRRFGSNPAVVGRTLELDGMPAVVAGVLAPGIEPPGVTADLWVPYQLDPNAPPQNHHVFPGVGRLRPGVTPADAERELARMVGEFPERFPSAYSPRFMERYRFTASVTPLRDSLVGGMARVLWVLSGSVMLVFLVACINVGNLFLVRAESRRREVAIREALGASRRQLSALFVSESLLLCGAAGVLGIALARPLTGVLVALLPRFFPRLAEIAPDARTTLFGLVLATVAGVAFGALPLVRRSAGTGNGLSSSRGLTLTRGGQWARRVLVAGQVALSVILVAGAGLMVQSFRRLQAVHPGFDPDGVLAFRVVLLPARYSSSARVDQFLTTLRLRLSGLPGVTASTWAGELPLEGMNPSGCNSVGIEGRPLQPGERPACVTVVQVGADYFRTLGIPVEGAIPSSGPPAVVVSRAFARRFWGGEPSLGKGIIQTDTARVVAVAGDVRGFGLDQPPIEAVYELPRTEPVSLEGEGPIQMTVLVRTTSTDPTALVPAIRRLVADLDPEAPVSDVRTMKQVVARSMIRVSMTMSLIAVSAGMALALSALSIYGVFSYLVAERRREIGIQIALGASSERVTRTIVRQSLVVAGAGAAIGVGVALGLTRLLEALLFEVSARDPGTFAAAVVVLLFVAWAATYGPARRAARVDPMDALRTE